MMELILGLILLFLLGIGLEGDHSKNDSLKVIAGLGGFLTMVFQVVYRFWFS